MIGFGGGGAQAEAKRLGAILAAFPTTQAQDEALLAATRDDAGREADWRMRRILEFRIQRKRALRCAQARLAWLCSSSLCICV